MVKKLKGDLFLLSANDLKTGEVVFLSDIGWSNDSINAIKIKKTELEKFEKRSIEDEEKCIIISSRFVELDEYGKIKSLRDKIRDTGLTIKL